MQLLSLLADRPDETRGALFEGRFKSVAILDDELLLGTCAYIDLNPVAAGIADVPEASPHTSITERVEHVKVQGHDGDLEAAGKGSVARSNAAEWLEESHWLCPIEDRRRLDSSHEGMIEGFSMGSCQKERRYPVWYCGMRHDLEAGLERSGYRVRK